jgi:phosphatidylglycerol:prolipoprotein diacylglycerol transferase
MHPVLWELGPLTLRTYGLFLAVSFLAGVALAVKRGERRDVKRKDIYDLSFTIMASSIVGSRLFYVLGHWGEYVGNPLSVFYFWEGGLSMFGGIVLALIASWWFAAKRKLSFARLGDIIAPSLALGTAITRIGCFMNGCCFGLPTEGSCGLVFPSSSAAGSTFPGTPLQPIQLYSALAALVLFVVLLAVDRTKRRDGFLFGLLWVLYAAGRIVIDEFRYYEESSVFHWAERAITYNQIIALGLIGIGLFFMFSRR